MDKLGIFTQVGQHSQLNLAVVGTDQHTVWTRYKSIPDVDFLLSQVLRDKNICFCPYSVSGNSLQATCLNSMGV